MTGLAWRRLRWIGELLPTCDYDLFNYIMNVFPYSLILQSLLTKYRPIMMILISDNQYRNDIPPMMNDNLSCHDDCIKNTRKTKQRTTG